MLVRTRRRSSALTIDRDRRSAVNTPARSGATAHRRNVLSDRDMGRLLREDRGPAPPVPALLRRSRRS